MVMSSSGDTRARHSPVLKALVYSPPRYLNRVHLKTMVMLAWGQRMCLPCRARRPAGTLRAIVQVTVGASEPLQTSLLVAESGEAADLQNAMLELNRLPALIQRHLIGRYIKHQTDKPKSGKTPPKNLEGAGRLTFGFTRNSRSAFRSPMSARRWFANSSTKKKGRYEIRLLD